MTAHIFDARTALHILRYPAQHWDPTHSYIYFKRLTSLSHICKQHIIVIIYIYHISLYIYIYAELGALCIC